MPNQNTPKLIAFTFDDGPNTTITPLVLDLLEKYNCPATFFLIGNNINEKSAECVRRAKQLGCEIANHTMSHPAMPELSTDEMLEEVEKTTELIYKITGEKPIFFRAPYIATNALMFKTIPYTFISGIGVEDWDDAVTAQERIKRVHHLACDGMIVLLHDMEENYATVEALETLIPTLLEQGFQFVTLSQLFELKGKSPKDEKFKGRNVERVE